MKTGKVDNLSLGRGGWGWGGGEVGYINGRLNVLFKYCFKQSIIRKERLIACCLEKKVVK